MPKVAFVIDRPTKALGSVNGGRLCDGCGRPFEPRTRNARHCRPSCRVLALQARRRRPLLDDGDALTRSPFE